MSEILQHITQISEPLIFLLLLAAGAFLVAFIKKIETQIEIKTGVSIDDKYINIACDVVRQSVAYTAQTFVDALKSEGAFTEDKQLEAFETAKDMTLNILGDAIIDILDGIFDDTEAWLDTKIEQACRELKETAEKGGTKNVN